MTIAEIGRRIESQKRIEKQKQKEKAMFDYTLADLIGRSVSRIFSKNDFPEISEVYPNLFDGEEIKAEKQKQTTSLSIARFKQFAQAHNQKMKNKEVGE